MNGTIRSSVFAFAKKYNSLFIFICILIAAGAAAGDSFFKPANVYNLAQTIGLFGILAAGLSLVFIVGGIDLSIGYQVAFCGTVFALIAPKAGLGAALACAILSGLGIGTLNGLIVTRLGIPSLIGTLAVMTVLKGVVLLVNGDKGGQSVREVTLPGDVQLSAFYNTKFLGLFAPSIIVALLLFIGLAFFLRYTRGGVNMYVTGGNPEAAALAGIDNGRVSRFAYTMCGFCNSLCAILLVMRNNASTYNMGDNIDIIAICAVVIGGIAMTGGRGNMLMCILGVAIIQTINNLMIKLSLQSSMQALLTGVIVIIVLIVGRLTGGKTEKEL
jgi:ribose transport system permease protein